MDKFGQLERRNIPHALYEARERKSGGYPREQVSLCSCVVTCEQNERMAEKQNSRHYLPATSPGVCSLS